MELLDRLLPGPPARLLDVGGGPGTYAAPLARRGYRVHLVDPVPLHVEQARQAAGRDLALRLHRRRGRRARAIGASRVAGRSAAVRAAVPPDRRGAAPAGPGRGPPGATAGRSPAGHGDLPVRFAARRALPGLAGGSGLPADRGPGPARRAAPQPRSRRQAGVLHHRLLPYPRRPGRRDRTGRFQPALPSTGSRARAGRCARSGQIRGGASRSCSQHAQSRHSPRLSASAITSSLPRPSRSTGPAKTPAMRHER